MQTVRVGHCLVLQSFMGETERPSVCILACHGLTFFKCVCVSVYVCVCERESVREKQRECVCVCVIQYIFVIFCYLFEKLVKRGVLTLPG